MIFLAEVEDEQHSMRSPRQMLATGFASPAEDYYKSRLNLNSLVVSNKTATYFFRVTSEDYKHIHIYPGDILVIDRSIDPQADCYAVIVLNDYFQLVYVQKKSQSTSFIDTESGRELIDEGLLFWGIITYVVHKYFPE